jgi:uroporphyrinogen-III synthase
MVHADVTETDQPLAGTTVALPEARRLDVFEQMLTKRGATIHRCPLVAIHDAPAPEPVDRWIEALIAGRFDDVVLYTGEGTRRLLGFADRAGQREKFIEALGRARRITRGPKPVQALREIGLKPNVQAQAPTTDGLVKTLATLDLAQRSVGVQMYGQQPNERLETALREAGAAFEVVYPYVYASHAEDAQVLGLIDALAAGSVTIVAFTSAAQVDRLWAVARRYDRQVALDEALQRVTIAAVGPVVGQALEARGLTVDAMPDEPFALKPLMHAIIAARPRAAAR